MGFPGSSLTTWEACTGGSFTVCCALRRRNKRREPWALRLTNFRFHRYGLSGGQSESTGLLADRFVSLGSLRAVDDCRDTLLVARYAGRWRWTLNPWRRRHRLADWDAGPVSDWCEADDLRAVEAARRAARGSDAAGTRIERQALAHGLGTCTRNRPHWRERVPEQTHAS